MAQRITHRIRHKRNKPFVWFTLPKAQYHNHSEEGEAVHNYRHNYRITNHTGQQITEQTTTYGRGHSDDRKMGRLSRTQLKQWFRRKMRRAMKRLAPEQD